MLSAGAENECRQKIPLPKLMTYAVKLLRFWQQWKACSEEAQVVVFFSLSFFHPVMKATQIIADQVRKQDEAEKITPTYLHSSVRLPQVIYLTGASSVYGTKKKVAG